MAALDLVKFKMTEINEMAKACLETQFAENVLENVD